MLDAVGVGTAFRQSCCLLFPQEANVPGVCVDLHAELASEITASAVSKLCRCGAHHGHTTFPDGAEILDSTVMLLGSVDELSDNSTCGC